jgi:hypothetical protein
MTDIATVEYDVGMVWVDFDYNREMIEELKAEIPHANRTYDPVDKRWGFTPSWWDAARRIIEQYMTIAD